MSGVLLGRLGRLWSRKLRRSRDKGAAAVEFALVMPLLVCILLGIMEFGYAFFIQAQVAGAARVAAREVAIQTATVPQAIAGAQVPGAGLVIGTPKFYDSYNQLSTTCSVGGQFTLTLTYPYKSLTGLFDGVLGLLGGATVSKPLSVSVTGSMPCGG